MKDMISPPTTHTAPTAGQPPTPGTGAPAKKFNIVDLKQYFHVVVKRIWLVALCFVIALGVMVVMLVREVPVYRASTDLLLTTGIRLPVQEREVAYLGGADFMQTQIVLINSGLVMQRARERVGRPSSEIRDLLVGVGVSPVWRTSMLRITVTSYDPVFAAEFANAIAEEYLDFKAEERMTTSQTTVISLTQQANRISEELRRAESRVAAFERENRIIAISERGNIAADNLANLSSQAAAFRTQKLLLEAQQPLLSESSDEVILATLSPSSSMTMGSVRQPLIAMRGEGNAVRTEAGGAAGDFQGPEALLDMGIIERPSWLTLSRRKARLESELAELRSRFRDAHPSIQDNLREIKETERELEVELQFALRQYYSDLEALEIRYTAARRAEMAWEDEAIAVARKAKEYETLQRSVERLRSLYSTVFNRLKEIDISIGIEPETIQIIQRATPPSSPSAPRKLNSIFLAGIIGLGVGLGLVFGLEFIDDSVRYPDEVTKGLGLPFFGVVPSANWDPSDLRSHMLSNLDQKSGMSEAYRNIRSAFLFSGPQDSNQVIVFTSAVPKEGKTTSCINLGVSLAQAGGRVLIVDGDMRRGEVHKFFGLEGGRGLSDVLTGQAKPEAVIQRTGIANLDIVATGPFPPNPAELSLRPELQSFLEIAKRSYDRILIDCPPIMAVSESGILASQADGVIFVVWAGQTSRRLSQLSVQVLRERGANMLGCILNNLEFARVGYYYYSTYYGYYDYDYRYEEDRPRTTTPT
jgi:polysaccharide biosynthesis transport protein